MAEDRHAKLRRLILSIATEIIRNEGLSALQARRLAKSADCSVGTLYNVYGNLDRLIIAANTLTLDDLMARLNARVDQLRGMALDDALVSLASEYLKFANTERGAWRALFEHRLTTEQTVPDDYRLKQAELFAVVETVLSLKVDDPSERQIASRAIFGAVHGIVTLALDEKLRDFDEQQTEQQLKTVVGAIARGL